jgi:hypothetical protein
MLQAVSGKSKESFIQQLKDFLNKDLYEFHNKAALNQLIITLVNLYDVFQRGSFQSIVKSTNRKLRIGKLKKNKFTEDL